MRERFSGFPWLASAWADYMELEFTRESVHLTSKKWPAPAAAARVRELSVKAADSERRARVAEYLLLQYESLFPFLVDYRDVADAGAEELALAPMGASVGEPEDGDAAAQWLTPQEYRRLPDTQKYQLALDRYWMKQKTRWEIGRDYERFIGYKYERLGFFVRYQGILEGFSDFGRDLIASKDGVVEIVQCKYWSQHRQIHEKHIFQLLGTALAYKLEHPTQQVTAVFVTTTSLSERAKQFAEELGAAVPFLIREREPFEQYPCIKCNVSRRGGSKIYHLPFDQQYDAVLIEEERLERYVTTVAEAEKLGYRRAKRWLGA